MAGQKHFKLFISVWIPLMATCEAGWRSSNLSWRQFGVFKHRIGNAKFRTASIALDGLSGTADRRL